MLPAKPDSLRVALNRVTFGARDTDVITATQTGWAAWVDTQLNPPDGDDPQLAAFIKAQVMPIKYAAANPEKSPGGSWPAVNEMRPLNYLNADIPALWNIYVNSGGTVSFAERLRIRQELAAATWIRNTHSKYQLREFMVDFWHNHFNVGKNENEMATALLPAYDRLTIRPNALGNFRTLLRATAMAPSMLVYLDNWASTATTPNENYAREIMELHTMGGDVYYGTTPAANVPKAGSIALGFTDEDVVHASRALSGWTIEGGQRFKKTVMPSTGQFVYNSAQHNINAGTLLGAFIAPLTAPMEQGEKFLEIIATHPATATFVVTKIAKRIFGDTPPQAVIDRGKAAWLKNTTAPDQIAKTLRAMLVDGNNEIVTAPVAKVRRPYERVIALARTTEMIVSASTLMTSVLDPVNDGLFAWQAPNGRPDVNGYWLATGATVTTWNLLLQLPYFKEITTTLLSQTPETALPSATAVVEYWVERMVGMTLSNAAMNALIADQAGPSGVPNLLRTNSGVLVESGLRRLVGLIATSEEFSLR
jgi:uncharacterized protein (DUF1800 family)